MVKKYYTTTVRKEWPFHFFHSLNPLSSLKACEHCVLKGPLGKVLRGKEAVDHSSNSSGRGTESGLDALFFVSA